MQGSGKLAATLLQAAGWAVGTQPRWISYLMTAIIEVRWRAKQGIIIVGFVEMISPQVRQRTVSPEKYYIQTFAAVLDSIIEKTYRHINAMKIEHSHRN